MDSCCQAAGVNATAFNVPKARPAPCDKEKWQTTGLKQWYVVYAVQFEREELHELQKLSRKLCNNFHKSRRCRRKGNFHGSLKKALIQQALNVRFANRKLQKLVGLLEVIEGSTQAGVTRVTVASTTPHTWLPWHPRASSKKVQNLVYFLPGAKPLMSSLFSLQSNYTPKKENAFASSLKHSPTQLPPASRAFNFNARIVRYIRSINAAKAIQLILQCGAALGFLLKLLDSEMTSETAVLFLTCTYTSRNWGIEIILHVYHICRY